MKLQTQRKVSEHSQLGRAQHQVVAARRVDARRGVDAARRALRYRVTASAEVGAPPDEVWDLYCDPHRYPEFAHATERMLHVPEGPMGVGYAYREIGVMGPFKSEEQWTVTEFEPHRRQVHVVDDGPIGMHLEIEIEPTASGCRITQGFGVEPRGAMQIMLPVLWPMFMRRLVQHAMERTVANYKRAAEATKA